MELTEKQTEALTRVADTRLDLERQAHRIKGVTGAGTFGAAAEEVVAYMQAMVRHGAAVEEGCRAFGVDPSGVM